MPEQMIHMMWKWKSSEQAIAGAIVCWQQMLNTSVYSLPFLHLLLSRSTMCNIFIVESHGTSFLLALSCTQSNDMD